MSSIITKLICKKNVGLYKFSEVHIIHTHPKVYFQKISQGFLSFWFVRVSVMKIRVKFTSPFLSNNIPYEFKTIKIFFIKTFSNLNTI